mgnify:CR=1 FL=1
MPKNHHFWTPSRWTNKSKNAFFVFLFVNLVVGFPVTDTSVIGQVIENQPAENVLQAGDKVLFIDGIETKTWEDVSETLDLFPGKRVVEFTVLRDGETEFNLLVKTIILAGILFFEIVGQATRYLVPMGFNPALEQGIKIPWIIVYYSVPRGHDPLEVNCYTIYAMSNNIRPTYAKNRAKYKPWKRKNHSSRASPIRKQYSRPASICELHSNSKNKGTYNQRYRDRRNTAKCP